jgi:gluconokinase
VSARRSDPAVLAVDIGSSGTRAAIVGLDGKISAGPFILPHSFSSPEPLASELDPDKIVRNVLACCRQALKTVPASKLSGASFSVFMHSLMAVDRRGRPLTPLITLGDRRAQPQSRLLEGRLDARAVRRRTGCWIHPVYAPAKALWLKQSLGPRWKQADWVCSLKEYLIERLFGVRECDFSTASSSGLMNLSRQSWDDGVLDALEMSPRILSDLADVEFALPKSRSSERILGDISKASRTPSSQDCRDKFIRPEDDAVEKSHSRTPKSRSIRYSFREQTQSACFHRGPKDCFSQSALAGA